MARKVISVVQALAVLRPAGARRCAGVKSPECWRSWTGSRDMSLPVRPFWQGPDFQRLPAWPTAWDSLASR
ncbi:hypothetical protein BVIET440_250063 [Burkholderia vietnamiensis]